MKKQDKKGDVNWVIILTIVGIASFAVLLFFLFRLNLGATTNKDVCYNSVALMAKSKGTLGALNCKTDYICISGGGQCSDLTPTLTVNVNANSKDEIYKAIADKMADCWWMFGEGKLDYSNGNFDTLCAICSVIKFDSTIQDNYPEGLTYKEFFDYMQNTSMETSSATTQQSYLSYLFGDNIVETKLAYLQKYNVPEISLKDKYLIRTGQINRDFGGAVLEFIFGQTKIYHLYPYFFDINHIPDPQCTSILTKA